MGRDPRVRARGGRGRPSAGRPLARPRRRGRGRLDDPRHGLERAPPGAVRRRRSRPSIRTGSTRAIAAGLREAGFDVRTATLDEPEHGLTDAVLAATDVLTWWGHVAHAEVDDAIVDRVQRRVLDGMGLIVLHSGHHSKIFRG